MRYSLLILVLLAGCASGTRKDKKKDGKTPSAAVTKAGKTPKNRKQMEADLEGKKDKKTGETAALAVLKAGGSALKADLTRRESDETLDRFEAKLLKTMRDNPKMSDDEARLVTKKDMGGLSPDEDRFLGDIRAGRVKPKTDDGDTPLVLPPATGTHSN